MFEVKKKHECDFFVFSLFIWVDFKSILINFELHLLPVYLKESLILLR